MLYLPKPDDCKDCSLFRADPVGFTNPEGSGSSQVAIFGEAAGREERKEGLPFRPYAEAGSILERAFRRIKAPREVWRIYNTIQCQPPKNWLDGAPWEAEAISRCRPYRDKFINEMRPKAILTLGGVSTRTITGLSGRKRGISMVRGYVVPAQNYFLGKGHAKDCNIEWMGIDGCDCDAASPIPVIPSFHPSYIRRGETRLLGVLYRDMLRALQVAKTGFEWKKPGDFNYVIDPSREIAEAFLREVSKRRDLPLTYDIETSTSADQAEDEIETGNVNDYIVSIQFSLRPGEGYYFPWTEPFISIAKEILNLPNDKWGFNNFLFDDPLLMAAGVKFGGDRHDLMTAWSHLQPDLPASLQFVASFYSAPFPWKHMSGSDSEIYGCCDVDNPQRIGAKIFDDLRDVGIYRGYDQHVFKLRRCLERVEVRGMPINEEKRSDFRDELQIEEDKIFAEIQAMVPNSIRNLHPSSKGYVRTPKELVELTTKYAFLSPEELRDKVIEEAPKKIKVGFQDDGVEDDESFELGEWDYRPITFKKKLTKKAMVADGSWDSEKGLEQRSEVTATEWRWLVVKHFLPNSSKQLIAYMQHKNHPIPQHRKKGTDTTGAKELERLGRKTRDPIYEAILSNRRFRKMKATYADGWAPRKSTGRVHTQFTFRPANGQLSSRNPNVQNGPKHSELAKKFREMIEAPKGYSLVEIDYSGFHVLTTGLNSGDEFLFRIARMDPHSFLASHFANVDFPPIQPSWSDDEIRAATKEFKSDPKRKLVRNKQAKPAILGYGFGLGVKSFYEQNLEYFKSISECRLIYKLLDKLFPVAAQWRNDIRKKAHRAGKLVTPHGYIRYFHEVYRWNPRNNIWEPGNDSEKAIAFGPANDAFGHIKDAMNRLEDRGLNERFGLINQIHDSLMFCCLNELVQECVKEVSAEMIKPSKILKHPKLAPDGLWCGVEAEVGPNWNAMEEVSA